MLVKGPRALSTASRHTLSWIRCRCNRNWECEPYQPFSELSVTVSHQLNMVVTGKIATNQGMGAVVTLYYIYRSSAKYGLLTLARKLLCKKANLRDLIAATGLVILFNLDSNR